ncbi:MAG: hypothetical protein L0387_37035 [Acidobacteria bacterium]|nr:hypothetical protein [Acidobacteriota bacterium]MCI0627194.1 hypothetical protein [Acidobacteriota bacterium]MCI0720934.1 hypothetical protein [Acidobacteriota bacterium]
MKPFILACLASLLVFHNITAAEFPQAEISNSHVRAKLYLPDAQQGYYRGTRFDWSGVVASLEWNGHNYFGKWFERYDPKLHDAITGPVEEFFTNNAGLGYDEAKPGERFVKIGVGALRKPDEPRYSSFNAYEIVDSGKWSVKMGPDWIEFVHELPETSGYAYTYQKKMRLSKDKPELVLEHSLKNTGRKVIATSAYNHNFFMLDGEPTGPDFVVRFPFDLRATADLKGLAEIRGKELVYLQELQKGQTVFTNLEGHGSNSKDYDIRVENRKTGAGVRQTGDRPLSKVVFWSIRSNISPEPYIDMRIEPGKESTWRIIYEFYAVPKSAKK